MMGAEAAGELVTGALVAGAIEGRSGERHARGEHASLCLNCGTALLGSYCHRCGQAEHVHRSLSAIWHDIAHGVLHFEGKIWNTLPLLAWRPGELTRRYIHGERARFVSPMALFLFSVFLMFATFGAIGAHLEFPDNTPPSVSAQAQAKAKIPQVQAELDKLRAEQKAARDPTTAAALDRRADKLDEDLEGLSQIANWQPGRFADLKTGWKRLDEGFAKANKNPNLALYKMQSSAYKYSWALILISVPFVWLLYAWHRKYKVYDHAVFVTYSLSFMSILVIALTLLGKAGVGEDGLALAALVIPPLHMYRQIRGAYGTRRRWAILRTLLLVAFAAVTLTVFFLLLFAVGALG
ncbi:DUF3667 domain-containing protein [Sphingomonas sp.]|jgi:hypothetical protein|uniref:DUF3667 domain-containing protein n=1 Tax=Sphingomonas sp. TaxID=28214 RepID=UPI002DE599DE|nr:DUF3667 domain-containing protein [Sphingomonas sp.]